MDKKLNLLTIMNYDTYVIHYTRDWILLFFYSMVSINSKITIIIFNTINVLKK